MSKLLIGCTWGGNNRYASIKKQICKKKQFTVSWQSLAHTTFFGGTGLTVPSLWIEKYAIPSWVIYIYIYICALACTCRNGCVTAFYFYQPCWYRFLQSWVPFLGVAIIILIIQDGLVNDGLVSLLILRSLGSLNPHRDWQNGLYIVIIHHRVIAIISISH